ncbi:MAG TPA: hypothetical protein VIM52_02025, partial [Stellaceae bacterium]
MASATDIATAESTAPPTGPPEPPSSRPQAGGEWSAQGAPRGEARTDVLADGARADGARLRRWRWPSVSPLTRRIVAVNVLPLALLA